MISLFVDIMKKILKCIVNVAFTIVVTVLIIYIVGMQFFPKQLGQLVGYRTFVILTDSMEPTIPVGSLVISKVIESNEEIKKDTIISFRVNRLGYDSVFTHYFKKKEMDETGKERYYTQAENADRYDEYKTYREDILGTYILHIPYVGKFVLFLQSPFALLELGIILIIILINKILWDKFDREEKEALSTDENADDVVEAEEICEIETEVDSEAIPQITSEADNEEASSIELNMDIESIQEIQIVDEIGETAVDTDEIHEPETEEYSEEVEQTIPEANAEDIQLLKPKADEEDSYEVVQDAEVESTDDVTSAAKPKKKKSKKEAKKKKKKGKKKNKKQKYFKL